MMLVAVFALAGCSFLPASLDVPPTVPTAIAVPPATGQTFSGTGYSFAAPNGWSVPPDLELPDLVELAVVAPADADGFSDNINVSVDPAVKLTPKWVESRGVEELERSGASDVEVRNRVMVAGSESAHLAAVYAVEDLEYQVEQFYVSNDEQTYVITFSFTLAVPEADRDILAESVLASWTWV